MLAYETLSCKHDFYTQSNKAAFPETKATLKVIFKIVSEIDLPLSPKWLFPKSFRSLDLRVRLHFSKRTHVILEQSSCFLTTCVCDTVKQVQSDVVCFEKLPSIIWCVPWLSWITLLQSRMACLTLQAFLRR